MNIGSAHHTMTFGGKVTNNLFDRNEFLCIDDRGILRDENGEDFEEKWIEIASCPLFKEGWEVVEEEPTVEEVLSYLTDAWNLFVKMEKQHPDERNDFADGINKCQGIIAMRVARQHRPDLFPKKE